MASISDSLKIEASFEASAGGEEGTLSNCENVSSRVGCELALDASPDDVASYTYQLIQLKIQYTDAHK
jgi:hypothetical protein